MPDSTPDVDAHGWVRVTDRDTGHKLSLRASQVAHGNFTVLKADASDPLTGDPLPPEFNAVKPTASSGQSADTEKEKSDG